MARGREPDYRTYETERNSRDRDRSPMRSYDKTSNPETISARIFVQNLTADITREMIEDHFSRWGNVICVSLSKNNFGFVQFEKETEAQACLAAGYSTVINGIRINVKQAKQPGGQSEAPSSASGMGDMNSVPVDNESNRWSSRSAYGGSRDHTASLPLPPPREERYYDYYREESNARDEESLRYEAYYRDYYDRPSELSSSSYYREELDPLPPARSYDTSSYASYPTDPLDPLDPIRPNDIEIVVPNKAQRPFAENIEGQLKRLNLLVDLLFPPPDITPARVLRDLTDRHCLYAIFATAENEKHNSLTLNILHGEQQEHRNMPVDDALRLVQRNFEDYVKQTRQRNMRQSVPRDVRNLLLDLLELRSLSMGDLDKLIKFLRERQNALVDDQIEQKREIAETQSSLVAESMAVTYPGYNYIASTVPGGAVSVTNPASVAAAQTAGILSGAQQAASMNLVSSANHAAAAAAMAAYPATAYTGLSATGMIGAYGVAPQAPASHQVIPGTNSVVPAAAAAQKQSELQERILNLMKGQGGLAHSGMAVPSGVPAPTGVPPPSVAPAQRMVQHQQHQQPHHQQQQQQQQTHQQQHQQPPPQHHMWMQHSARPADNIDNQANQQQVYNPWG